MEELNRMEEADKWKFTKRGINMFALHGTICISVVVIPLLEPVPELDFGHL